GADQIYAAGIEFRSEGQPAQRRVAAVRAAQDGDAPGIGDSLPDGPADGIRQVVLHGADAPLAVASVQELYSEAGRAAKVHLEDGIPAVREQLDDWIELPSV